MKYFNHTSWLIGSLLATQIGVASSSPTANTVNGTYEGKSLESYEQDLFLGIPYALPPTGLRRFQRPHYINETFEGVRDAIEYGRAASRTISALLLPFPFLLLNS